MGQSRFISAMAIVAGILILSAGVVRAVEPTPDQLKQQIKELQSKLDRAEIELLKSSLQELAARVGQLEAGQADSSSPRAMTKAPMEAAVRIIEEPVAVDQTTEEPASPAQEEFAAQSELAEGQADTVDLPDTEDVAATTEEVAGTEALEEPSGEIAAIATDEAEISEPALPDESVGAIEIFVTQDDSLADVQDEPAGAIPSSEVIEQLAPAMQPAAVSSVDLSATDAVDRVTDDLSVVQVDQESFDDLPPTAPNP